MSGCTSQTSRRPAAASSSCEAAPPAAVVAAAKVWSSTLIALCTGVIASRCLYQYRMTVGRCCSCKKSTVPRIPRYPPPTCAAPAARAAAAPSPSAGSFLSCGIVSSSGCVPNRPLCAHGPARLALGEPPPARDEASPGTRPSASAGRMLRTMSYVAEALVISTSDLSVSGLQTQLRAATDSSMAAIRSLFNGLPKALFAYRQAGRLQEGAAGRAVCCLPKRRLPPPLLPGAGARTPHCLPQPCACSPTPSPMPQKRHQGRGRRAQRAAEQAGPRGLAGGVRHRRRQRGAAAAVGGRLHHHRHRSGAARPVPPLLLRLRLLPPPLLRPGAGASGGVQPGRGGLCGIRHAGACAGAPCALVLLAEALALPSQAICIWVLHLISQALFFLPNPPPALPLPTLLSHRRLRASASSAKPSQPGRWQWCWTWTAPCWSRSTSMCSPQTGEPGRQLAGPHCVSGHWEQGLLFGTHIPMVPATSRQPASLPSRWVLTPCLIPPPPLLLQARPALADGQPDAGARWAGGVGAHLPAARRGAPRRGGARGLLDLAGGGPQLPRAPAPGLGAAARPAHQGGLCWGGRGGWVGRGTSPASSCGRA